MDDQQLLRYARHLLLDEIGIEGQRALLAAHALVIGAGGLGSPAAMYLGTAGVGRITVVDDDDVDLTNLQRQIAHDQSRIGQPKALSVQATLAAINPDLRLRALVRRADAALLDELLPQVDVVLDCCDNFRTRHAVNAACVRHGRPLVSGAAIGWDAQIAVYDTRDAAAPCYACLFPADAAHEDVACSTMGVFAPLVGIVGAMQAAEAIKLLLPGARSLAGRLLMLDARSMEWTDLRLPRQSGCAVCADRKGAALEAAASR
ncbi:MAG: HesA/MoeB/ThiF family protein [Burkholderiales bacterium]|nr:HesA/MoeB/ThiF family protein [Burkholderiales bacterium]